MAINRAKKETDVQELQERFNTDELVVLTHNKGLTVKDMSKLRAEGRAKGVSFKITKNTLAKIASRGTKFEGLGDMFTGPTGMASSKDSVAAAKVVFDYAKTNDKLVIVGGALGSLMLDRAGVEQLAKLPSLDEIRSKLVGLLQAPATKLVGVLQAPARDLVGVTRAYGEKGQ